jgi:hypothetical protein
MYLGGILLQRPASELLLRCSASTVHGTWFMKRQAPIPETDLARDWAQICQNRRKIDEKSTKNRRKIHQKCEKSNARLKKNRRKIHQKSTKDSPKIDERFTKNRRKIHQKSTKNRRKIDENRRKIDERSTKIDERFTKNSPKIHQKFTKDSPKIYQKRFGYIYNIIYSFNFIHFLKFPQCERSEPLFPLNFLLQFHTLPQISPMRAQRAPVPP